ncbi:MAG: DNA-binding protein [Thermoproteota archaeon]
MSIEDVKTQLTNNHSFSNKERTILIQRQPIMECAIDVLTALGNAGKVVLKAKGDDIPTAVGVANVVTEKMMKGTSEIVDIIIDSESGAGKYGMTLVSTIEIILAKKLN